MSWDSKVLWTEGLFLQPHHFQQSDRYAEGLVAGLAHRLTPYAWGVSQLEIDDEALKVGKFALKSCAGLTQDGVVFRVPQKDDHPPALEVPDTVRDCVVYLTVPQRRQGAREVDLSGAENSECFFLLASPVVCCNHHDKRRNGGSGGKPGHNLSLNDRRRTLTERHPSHRSPMNQNRNLEHESRSQRSSDFGAEHDEAGDGKRVDDNCGSYDGRGRVELITDCTHRDDQRAHLKGHLNLSGSDHAHRQPTDFFRGHEGTCSKVVKM